MKIEYSLRELNCMHCAEKIGAALNKLPQVKQADVSFANKKLTLELSDTNVEEFEAEAQRLIQSIEPDCVLEKYNNKPQPQEEHHHHHHHNKGFLDMGTILSLIGVVLYGVGFLLEGAYQALTFIIAGLLIGYPVFWQAIKRIRGKSLFDEYMLMTIAVIGAGVLGYFSEAVAVVLFYRVGEYLEDYAVERSRKSVKALVELRPEVAHVIKGDNTLDLTPEEVAIGDVILIKQGERVPLDVEVIEGTGAADTSAITGESFPQDCKPGAKLLSGSVLLSGTLKARVEKEYINSAVTRILDMVENAPDKKSKTEKLISRFAKYYTPAVVILAALIAVLVPIIIGEPFSKWIHRALVLLVISCPCALVLSVPLCYFAGIGSAARRGILYKGSDSIEALRTVKIAAFDKTGTLTQGVFKLSQILPEAGFKEEEMLLYASSLERYSTHPLAKSIAAAGQGGAQVLNFAEQAGRGVSGEIDGRKILLGNKAFLQEHNIATKHYDQESALMYMAVDGQFAGVLVLTDSIKPATAKAIEDLKETGIYKTVLLSGDRQRAADHAAAECGIDAAHGNLLPQDKAEYMDKLEQEAPCMYIGDGINDAPVLTRATVGISMGQAGSDIALEVSDIVLIGDDLSLLAKARQIANNVGIRSIQNITLALGIKGVFVLLGAIGLSSMWMGVFADVGVTLLCVLNSLRPYVKDKKVQKAE